MEPRLCSAGCNRDRSRRILRRSLGRRGRYVAIECRSTHAADQVAVAELYLLDANGKRLSRVPNRERQAV